MQFNRNLKKKKYLIRMIQYGKQESKIKSAI